MTLFLKYLHPRIEELIGVVFVVSDARAEHVDKCKTFVRDGAFEQVDQMLLFSTETP